MVKARRGLAMSSGGSALGGKALSIGTGRHFSRVYKRATDLWEVRCSCGWSSIAESSYDAARSGKEHVEVIRRLEQQSTAQPSKTKKAADSATSPNCVQCTAIATARRDETRIVGRRLILDREVPCARLRLEIVAVTLYDASGVAFSVD